MISEESKSSLRRLMEVRTARDEAKRALEIAEAEFREKEQEIFDTMQEDGIKGTIKVELGEPWGEVAFRTRETVYGRIIDEDAATEHFKARGMLAELTAPKFAKKRLNELVRDAREQGMSLPPARTTPAAG